MTRHRCASIKPLNDDRYLYHLEYRRPKGFDDIINTVPTNADGLFVIAIPEVFGGYRLTGVGSGTPAWSSCVLLDLDSTVSNPPLLNLDRVTLNGGNKYFDARSGVTIGPIISNDNDGITFSVQISSSTYPAVPRLASPANTDSPPVQQNPRIKWRKVPGATSYDVQVARGLGFPSLVVLQASTSDTVLQCPLLADLYVHYWRVRANNTTGTGLWSDIWKFAPFSGIASTDPSTASLPTFFVLNQNYPNPFNPSTTIRYGLPQRSQVTLTVYNTLGQQVAVVQNVEQEAGYYEVKFDGKGVSSGMYFYRIQAGDFVATKRLLLLR